MQHVPLNNTGCNGKKMVVRCNAYGADMIGGVGVKVSRIKASAGVGHSVEPVSAFSSLYNMRAIILAILLFASLVFANAPKDKANSPLPSPALPAAGGSNSPASGTAGGSTSTSGQWQLGDIIHHQNSEIHNAPAVSTSLVCEQTGKILKQAERHRHKAVVLDGLDQNGQYPVATISLSYRTRLKDRDD